MKTQSTTPATTSSRLVLKKERLVNLSTTTRGNKIDDITTMSSSFLF